MKTTAQGDPQILRIRLLKRDERTQGVWPEGVTGDGGVDWADVVAFQLRWRTDPDAAGNWEPPNIPPKNDG